MKNFARNVTCVTFCLLVINSFVFGQSRQISEGEIDELKQRAHARLANLSYRENFSILEYLDNESEPNYSSIFTTEYLRPDRTHSVWEQKTDKGNQRIERIKIGSVLYIKRDNDPWKIEEEGLLGGGGGIGSGFPGVPPEIRLLCEYISEEEIKGVPTHLYQKTRKTIVNTSKGEIVTISTEKYWFNKDGLFIKTLQETRSNVSKRLSQVISEYEYDPNIKIEAPIK